MPAPQGHPECRRLPYLFQGVLIFLVLLDLERNDLFLERHYLNDLRNEINVERQRSGTEEIPGLV
ncbi:MAG: hypothetical protein C0613_10255 [Desulfobulbaceae bacterium]|nr:MAG: hypothetical protein C0613_10255 [Desulfobulbaceae bacterium]